MWKAIKFIYIVYYLEINESDLEYIKNILSPKEMLKFLEESLKWEKQHYVPRTYLKWFAQKEGIISFDISKMNYLNNANPVSLQTQAMEDDFYVTRTKELKYSYYIEEFFSHYIEKYIAGIIKKLETQNNLNDLEIETLSMFVWFQAVRTKSYADKFERSISELNNIWIRNVLWYWTNIERFRIVADRYQKETWKRITDIDELFEAAKHMDLVTNVSKEEIVSSMLRIWLEYSHIFMNSKLIVYHTSKNYDFVTSDNPFYIIPPRWWKYEQWTSIKWIGILYPPDARKIIPLSKNILLEIDTSNDEVKRQIVFKSLKSEKIKYLNSYTIKNCRRFVFWYKRDDIDVSLKMIDFKKLEKIKSISSVIYNSNTWVFVHPNIYPL